MLLAEKVEDLMKEGNKIRVVVVDSLTAHFRAEFVGRGTLAERQQKLNKHMRVLAKIADIHNTCVYVTNQVMAKPDAFFGDPTEAIGGHIVGHNSTFRIYLRKGKKGTRVAKLIDSPNLPDSECVYEVTEHGLKDVQRPIFFLFIPSIYIARAVLFLYDLSEEGFQAWSRNAQAFAC